MTEILALKSRLKELDKEFKKNRYFRIPRIGSVMPSSYSAINYIQMALFLKEKLELRLVRSNKQIKKRDFIYYKSSLDGLYRPLKNLLIYEILSFRGTNPFAFRKIRHTDITTLTSTIYNTADLKFLKRKRYSIPLVNCAFNAKEAKYEPFSNHYFKKQDLFTCTSGYGVTLKQIHQIEKYQTLYRYLMMPANEINYFSAHLGAMFFPIKTNIINMLCSPNDKIFHLIKTSKTDIYHGSDQFLSKIQKSKKRIFLFIFNSLSQIRIQHLVNLCENIDQLKAQHVFILIKGHVDYQKFEKLDNVEFRERSLLYRNLRVFRFNSGHDGDISNYNRRIILLRSMVIYYQSCIEPNRDLINYISEKGLLNIYNLFPRKYHVGKEGKVISEIYSTLRQQGETDTSIR